MQIDRWRSRLPVRRPADGELVGWTVSEAYDESCVDAVNPVGRTVASAIPVDHAAEVLVAQGLSSLMDPLWALVPASVSRGTDLRRPEPDWQWRRMVLVQLDDTRVWIRPGYPTWQERNVEIPLVLPVDDVLVSDPPPGHE